MFSDDDWAKLPFDKSFFDQAICLGTPVYRLRNAVGLQSGEGFDAKWGAEICEVLGKNGERDADRLDHALILRSYELRGVDDKTKEPLFVPKNYFVLVVHMRNAKLVAISGVTVLDCGRPPRVLFQKVFTPA
jgi:hypothetical protein